jgi:HEAT repeat protein
VRLNAAAAVTRVDPADPRAIPLIVAGLADPSASTRRTAAQCVARLGPPAKSALTPLLQIVIAPDSDENVRAAAVDAIGRLKADALPAAGELIKLLDDPTLRLTAAESLGRIGPGASSALPKLAAALNDADATWQWTAARAMVLIGGEGARPAVPFLAKRLEKAPRGRELYQLTWLLGLMGPLAKDTIPALQDAQRRDNELAAMAIWAIAPEEIYPWQIGYHWDRPCDLWLIADYIDRMGDRATPAAAALARRVLEGTAGNIPSWGYHLLAARPDAARPILEKGLAGQDPQVRRRARIALDAMGGTGKP